MTYLICDEACCAHNLMGHCRCGEVNISGTEACDPSMTGCMSFIPHYASVSRALDGIYAGLSGEFGALGDVVSVRAETELICRAYGCAFNDDGSCAHGEPHILARRASATGGIAQCSSFTAK